MTSVEKCSEDPDIIESKTTQTIVVSEKELSVVEKNTDQKIVEQVKTVEIIDNVPNHTHSFPFRINRIIPGKLFVEEYKVAALSSPIMLEDGEICISNEAEVVLI